MAKLPTIIQAKISKTERGEKNKMPMTWPHTGDLVLNEADNTYGTYTKDTYKACITVAFYEKMAKSFKKIK